MNMCFDVSPHVVFPYEPIRILSFISVIHVKSSCFSCTCGLSSFRRKQESIKTNWCFFDILNLRNSFHFLSAEDTLWTGNPGDYTDPQSPEVLSQVRKLVDNGQYAEATAAAAKLSGNKSEVCCLINFCCRLLFGL